MELVFRKAMSSEADIAFKLLKEAAKWLEEKNIDYWQNWHQPPKEHAAWIHEGFEEGQFYFVEHSDKVVGMYRLQYDDEIFWGKRNDKAGYIHSFTTDRSLKGRGIGGKILEHIERQLREEGINFLRLDCSPNISELCDYYHKHD